MTSIKVNKNVLERSKWEKFGLAKSGLLEDGSGWSSTIGETVSFELTNVKKKKKEEPKKEEPKKEEPKKEEVKAPTSLTPKYVAPGSQGGNKFSMENKRERDDQNTVRVSNLADETEEEDLRKFFRSCGQIARVYVAVDKETNQSKGFAFVTFRDQEGLEKAIKLDGKALHRMVLSVEKSKPSKK